VRSSVSIRLTRVDRSDRQLALRSYICVLMMSYIGDACSADFGTALTGRRNPLPINVAVLCVCLMNNTTTHAVVGHQADETGSPVLPGASACANNAVYRRTTPIAMRDLIMSCDRSAGRTHVHTGAVPCRVFSHSDDQLVICYHHIVSTQWRQRGGGTRHQLPRSGQLAARRAEGML
jgi:hypothetical protein